MIGRSCFALQLALLCAACSTERVALVQERAQPSATAQRVEFDPDTLERLGVRVEPAGGDGPGLRLQLPGTLEYVADQYAEVGSVVEGRVTGVRVTVGDRVKKGQVLATVLVPEIVTAQAEALTARAALKVAQEHLKRETTLLESQLTTKREEELARGDATEAEADLAAASAKLKLFGAPLPSNSEGISANGTIALTAPIEGVIVRREAVVGGFLEPRDTAFAIGNAATLWAVLDVYESDVESIQEGAEVEVRVDSIAGKLVRGKVSRVEPQLGLASRALRARVLLDNADGSLRPGLFVRASVPVADAPAGVARLRIPKAAVKQLGGNDVVFVERGRGKYEVRPVTVAHRTSQLADISDGLAAGERIVVHGAFVLLGEVTKQ